MAVFIGMPLPEEIDLTGVAPGFYILVVQPASGAPAVSVKLTVR